MRVFATAGHVDHGKSTLVRTLTGIDPDRWHEEKRRGLTIDIGFAYMTLPSGERISFIDVPGHIRFISNMLAGVGGIHGCVLTVDAREGWMPQTEEHLRILEFVGLRHGIIALTKIDLCDDDTRELAILDIADRVAGTFLASAPIVSVSSTTGIGIDELVTALDHMAHDSTGSIDRNRPRLFIDRVFAAKGSGTVVTGTLADGSFSVGDTVTITPMEHTARIRSIQSLGESHDTIGPGHRVALNLSGIDHGDIARGHTVVRPNEWFVSDHVDAHLDVLAHLDHAVSRRGAFTVHIGSDEIPARLRVLDADRIEPGSSANVRLYLDRRIPLLPGDRFVLRESGRSETIGGGEILDIDPVLSATRARPDKSIERIVDERRIITADHLRLLTDIDAPPTVGTWILSPDEHERRTGAIAALIDAADSSGFDIAQLDEIDRALVGQISGVMIEDGRVRRAGVEDPLVHHPAIARLKEQRCAPSTATDISPAELRRLAKIGLVFESQGEWFHRCALDDAHAAARSLLASHPDGFTVSQFREHLGITRKHAVPLASALDARGITRRRGDVRMAGPRL
jgi:selenocysteine-specific elongation factor